MIELRLGRSGRTLRCLLPERLGAGAAALRHYRRLTDRGPADHLVSIREGDRFAVVHGPGRTEVTAPPDSLTAAALQVLVDHAYYRDLDAAGRAVLHASAITDGSQVWAFWGASGAGKTTVAQALCRRPGWRMVSNGSLIVGLTDGRPVVHGTAKRHVKLRDSSRRGPDGASGPPGLSGVPGGSGVPDGSGVPGGSVSAGYEDKSEVALPGQEPDHPLPLTRFFTVRLVDALPEASLARLDPRRAGVQLYEDMARHLHGTEALLLDAEGRVRHCLPSANDGPGHRLRADLAVLLSRRGTALTGPLDACVRELTAPVPAGV
jgi:hypothetical protein